MRKLSVLVALLLILTVGVLPAAAITWGEPDTEHTNVGAMLVRSSSQDPWFAVCSGTLVHARVFLTAGHCTEIIETYNIPIDDVAVTFDADALAPTATLAVEAVETHPAYHWGPQSNPHDVGALILEEPVVGIDPATLPPEGFLDGLKKAGELRPGRNGTQFTVVGYGGTLDWPPPVITYEDQRQFAVSEYRALLKAWLVMSQNHAAGDAGTCYGDSGGPAFYSDNGTEYLVGVTSWGDAQCVATGINYRVDIPDTLNFIDSVTP